MVERIKTLLEERRLTPTQFADAIGVARPIVSHVLSGRNKPSLEVVQRILAAMPDISMAWLLNGTGPMLAGNSAPSASPAPAGPSVAKAPAATSLSSLPQPGPAAAPAPPEPVVVRAKRPVSTAVLHRFVASRPKQDATLVTPLIPAEAAEPAAPAPAAAAPAEEPLPPAPTAAPLPADPVISALAGTTEKAIRRIVIFYRDGSFADYQPEQ